MDKPLVSIVIPVYNGANYMREAIDSALSQTYENCEVIVVNDGSTDETEQIALSYGDRIRYFAKENGGVSTALNVGIQNMEGEYFCYLPHDDLFLPEKIEIQVEAIRKGGNPVAIVWSKTNLLSAESGECQEESTNYYYYDNALLSNGTFPVYLGLVRTISVMIHRQFFSERGTFNAALFTSQDYDMWYRTFIGCRTIYIDKPLVSYRIHEKQGTNTDPIYYRNCVELATEKFLAVTDDEVWEIWGNKYRFVYYMLVYYKEESFWKECWEEACRQFRLLEEPEDVEKESKELYRYLNGNADAQNSRIVLWCAGKNASRMLKEFYERDIPVYALCDGDKEKQGTMIQGYQCLSPEEVDRSNARIIVTKDNPEALAQDLRRQGFRYVTSIKEIGSRLHYTMPYKDRVIETRINDSL